MTHPSLPSSLQHFSDRYHKNPLTYSDRRRQSGSDWQRSFGATDLRPLIVCRGPIRKEALDTFEQMGITHCGVLLSEKDSIVYPQALAPESRSVRPERVHKVRDYTGATKEEREERVAQMIAIARRENYNAIFAGYGFMAEDEAFVSAIEAASSAAQPLYFIGPCAQTVLAAGHKDEAKRTALQTDVSVTPGVDNAAARTLLRAYADHAALRTLVAEQHLSVSATLLDDTTPLSDVAEAVLVASYKAQVELFSVEAICDEVARCVADLLKAHPKTRVRLKHVAGGGGKGQRIVSAGDDAATLAHEVLSEVKATSAGDNKNILVELNIEQTRHHEIQLVGNGKWCVALGGRDCSCQMHDQKLLEISLTEEELALAAEKASNDVERKAIEDDLHSLKTMEAEAERFGAAVGLDSASTFECIGYGGHHYFMEVNTRIQVEHRVSELCYALRFTNPGDTADFFDVTSLVELMGLLALHKERLPKPIRIRREGAAVEARINATDRSLSPHAGGLIKSWSDPIFGEIRDDQGICAKNPDTECFVRYRLSGAYDSNIALLLATGGDRRESLTLLAEILRRTKIEGDDLATNVDFQYGLVHWLLGQNVNAKITTNFVAPYLAQVGLLLKEAGDVDVPHLYLTLWSRFEDEIRAHFGADEPGLKNALQKNQEAFFRKQSLLGRPLFWLQKQPHVLAGWWSANTKHFAVENGRVKWNQNRIRAVADLYHFLNMDAREGAPALQVIWREDDAVLQEALAFYDALSERLLIDDVTDFPALDRCLANEEPPSGFDAELWREVRSAHAGFQRGLEVLDVLPLVGHHAAFAALRVEADLSVTIPSSLLDAGLQKEMKAVLSPPPAIRADAIVAASGGMFYARQAPDLPPLVQAGDHFEVGQPLYVVEVMKMFNVITAPFAGTVERLLIDGADGVIVRKGQPVFAVTPDVQLVEKDLVAEKANRASHTEKYLNALLPEHLAAFAAHDGEIAPI